MKILPKSKKAIPPPTQLADLIAKLLIATNEQLPSILKTVDSWKWPRSDLNSWIKVLNKFDDIMDEIIREYNVAKLQLNPFVEGTKELLSEILRFERLLLENSTNRKTFSSYDRLNGLLSTSDLDILVLALNLLLRPSQQYSAQPAVSHALSISTTRLQSLAKRLPHLREYGIGLVDLASNKGNDGSEGVPLEAREVNFSFYRTDITGNEPDKRGDEGIDAPSSSPRHVVTASSSAVHLRLDERQIISQPVMNVLADAIQTHSVPDSETFELLCRIRAAASLSSSNRADREKLVIIRLLAIAIYGHTHSESQATSALFLYEPDLVAHVAELLQVDQGIPIPVQTAAIAALDALARYKNKVQEVLTAVNAGVNHGILMALVRTMVAEVANPDSLLPHAFVEALLSFITYIASHASGGNMIVGAGLIPLLIQAIENRSPLRLLVVSKTMQLVDNVLYSFTNAFSLFCASRGVDVLVERIEYEIDLDIKEYAGNYQPCAINGTGELPIQRVAVLKHILRSMHRMMQSPGTAEGLRGLIDMSLLSSIKKIVQYRGLFGANIFPLAVNIMSTFVHNEPTSLAVIQEAGLPELFYKAIEIGIEPAIEVIQAIPNAIGALCLNEAGQAQLSKRPSIIPAILAIFTSERHLKVLIDKENAVIIGTAVDELIRHHPSLKSSVFDAIRSTLSNIEDLGMSFVCPTDVKQFYQLMPITGSAGDLLLDDDITMQDDVRETIEAPEESAQEPLLEADEDTDEDDIAAKNHDNTVVSFIDILGRFMEGFFQHSPHCRDFITSTDGLQRFGRLTGLPCLPYDFANSVASDSMVQVLRTMTEVATSETLLHLTEIVEESLDETRFFWESIQEPSKLLPFIDLPASESAIANQRFRSLVTLHIRITLLSDVFATARAAHRLIQTLMNSTPLQVLTNLGTLHRASMWENIALNVGLSSKGIEAQVSPSSTPLEGSPNRTIMELPDTEASVTANGANGANDVNTAPTLNPSENNSATKHDEPRDWNANSLKHITQGLPNALAPFFQAMIKMFHARRSLDSALKKQIMEASKVVAQIMLKHLSLRDFDDKPSLYNYFTLVLGLFNVLLVDGEEYAFVVFKNKPLTDFHLERTSASSLHTLELFAFYQSGGFDAISDICKILTTQVDKIVKIEDEHRSELQKKELSHAYSAIKIALHLLNPIVSSKPLFESGQTLLILTRDKKDTDPDYFEAHNFLVKLRFTVLPTIRDLWEAPWLIQAPIGVSRYVVRTVLEIANGEQEDLKSDSNGEGSPVAAGHLQRSTGPDEARIQILTDMGFPRSAAERALARTHNNVNSATELLLSQPHLLPDPASDLAVNIIDAAPEDAEGTSGEDEENANSSVSAGEPDSQSPHPLTEGNDQEAPLNPLPIGKTANEWRKALDEAREPLRASISRQSLLLIDEHLPLLFDLHIAFTKTGAHQLQAVRDLVDDIKAFSRFAYDVQEQPLANRCRLLALVLCENPSSLDQDLRNTLMDHLLALLLSSVNPEHPPRWLAAHLLVTEALLTLSDEPRTISLPKEDEPIEISPIPVGPPRAEAHAIVFDFCFRLLAIDDLPADELLSVLRLFVLLTRDREMAAQFVKREGLVSLFRRIKSSAVNGGSSYVATILRHVVEDVPIIQNIMQQTIKRYFTQHRARTIDVNTYVRNCSAIALRDMDIFIDSTKSLCHMGQPFSSSPHISLRAESLTEAKAPQSDVEPSMDMQVDVPAISLSNAPQKSVENVIQLLIVELMNTVKVINETPDLTGNVNNVDPIHSESPLAERIQSDIPISSNDMVDSTLSPPIDVHDKYQYLCFTMQCLTELLFSYDTCKVAFLSYSKKRSQQGHSKDQANKFRTTTLHFLLSDLITYGTISPSSDGKHRNKGLLCSWAMNVVGALCVDTSSAQEMKDISVDLTNVRKFVLETISRAIKDLPPMESTEARYGRLLALADLCHRLLTVRMNLGSRKQQDEVPTHMAKIMLEKNFVAILTTALSEIDLNYPNVRNLVAAMLRPLEHLTKIAIKMSRASSKNKEDVKKDASVSSGSEDDEETMEDGGREETPDVYRHSALGIYAGEMDVRHYSEDEDMDQEDEDQDVEMEYGDETGSEDTSSSGSDHAEEDLDHRTPDPWNDEGDEEEEDLVEQRDEEGDEEEEVGDDNDEGEDEEEDEDIMWEDIQEGEAALGMALEDVENEGGHGVPIHINHEEDEPDMGSDEEGFVLEHGNFHDGIFSFGDVFVNPGSRDGGGLFVHRRHRDHQPFSRLRHPPAAPEATTHPLLLDMTSSANRNNNIQGRGIRHAHRILGTGTGPPDILQTIDQMLGEGSIQILQQLTPHDGGGTETFRIEVPAGAILHHGRRLLGSSSRTERVPRPQHHRQGREFDPLLTLQRWAEEMKILHGDFVGERVGKLVNHVALALLPAAVEALKQTKLQAEEEALRKAEDKAKGEELLAGQENVEPSSSSTTSTTQPNQTTDTPVDSIVEPPLSTSLPEPAQVQSDTMMADTVSVHADAEMADDSEVPRASPQVNAEAAAPLPVVESSIQSSSDPSANVPERVTVMIHGSAVDITDTGIDPTFLEALPDDMREEVLNQHVRDQQAARVERPPDSQISSEFLDALPPEIRAEIIQQEALERSRRRPEESATRVPAAGEPADIDPASFIASLDPSLRQAVLMDQDDGFIQTLPSHMIAEAGVYRDEVQARRPPGSRNPNRAAPAGTPARKYTVQHDAILLLDRTGITVLVRLLFFPQVLKKALLFKVLVNLCENAKTRTELFNILLSILQDGTGDLAAVDKSFAQMSVRNRESKPLTPKAIGKQKATADYLTALALPVSQIETVPDLIAQRCLEALTYIVSNNQLSSVFFLTEHDLPVGLRRAAIKKGKGKEKQVSQSHYPLVLLLNLLDRQNLLRTPAILESVVNLLATITRPLSTLKEEHKVVSASGSASTAQPSEKPDSVPVNTTTNADIETLPSTQHPEHPVEQPVEQPSGDSPSTPITSSVTGPHGAEKPSGEDVEEKALLPHAPQVPHPALRLIVNILTIGECSGRTFQQSLALIQHLSNIPDARDVIAHELKSKAQEFGQALYSDLDELAAALQESSNNILISSVATKFSPASSTQAKLLRVLKTIDYMYTPKTSSTANNTSSDDVEKVQAIYESFRFTPLWRRLGDCLSTVGEKSETEHIATVLLPLIEALMVVCKFVGSKGHPTVSRALRASASPRSPTTPRESMEDLFISFTDAHRKVLNLMVRNNPSLMSGSFSLLVNNSRVLDFDNKRNYFNQQLHRKPHAREHYGTLQLNVRRARVFEDSFLYLQRKSGEQIKNGKLSVRFYDEEGVDAGGLTREWFQILARQMFNPNNALFQPCAADKQTYQPNKNSWVNPEHLSFFKFVGRVIGKAIHDGRLLDAYFARSLYRQLLGKPVDYRDVEWVDPEYYNSLCWILENDPTLLDLTFSVEADEFGVNRIVPLKDNGESISVTQENKREFVQLSAQYRLYISIKEQIESLSNGFYEIIPKDLITIFNEQELELLISGTPDIDVDEWRSATEYNGYTSSDPNIVWWWRALKSFNRDERAKVLGFATGTSRVPLSGFLDLQGVQGVQRFSIHRAYGEPDRLPQAHTCFNQIDLPQYTSYDMLRQQLLMAINEGGEGFAFS